MKGLLLALGVLLASGGVLPPTTARAQPAIDPTKSMIDIEYAEPDDPAYRPIVDRLKQRGVLEDFRDFLSPLKLPELIRIKRASCGGSVNAWYSQHTVLVCYEYIAWIRQMAPASTTAEGITREDAVVGPFVDVLLHELSHAVFDTLKVPVLG